MESRWYLFPGQTLENTKISDRRHALHVTKTTWDGITKHLDRTKLLQEAADKEVAIKRYLDEGSKNMTKGWENSLENVRKRKEEERLKSIEQKKEDRQKKFLELRKEQEEIRKKYMDKVKKQIFMTTGHARDLTSAFVTTEVGYERERQLEFIKKVKDHEREEEAKFAEKIRREAEQERIEKEEYKRREIEKKQKYGAMLKETIKEKSNLKKMIKEQKAKNEAMENIEAVEEQERLNELIKHDRMAKQKELFEEKKRYFLERQELQQQKLKEEKELDEVIEIYQESKHRIDCMRKQREQEMRDAILERRDKITEMVKSVQAARDEAESQLIKKAVAERDAVEIEKIKEKLEHHEQMKKDRIQYMSEVQAKEKVKIQEGMELKKWELLNRYKADEHMQKYEENKRKEMWQEILRYRKQLCDQMEDNRKEVQREKDIEKASFKYNLDEEDAKFFEYANEVVELAKQKGRSIVPIERVITKYVKQMNIDPYSFGLNITASTTGETKAAESKKKLIKPPKPKQCRCYCPKK